MSSAFFDVSSRNVLHSSNAINEQAEEDHHHQQQQQQYSGQELASDLRHCSISSNGSSIDIEGQPVSLDILAALLDRPAEMKGLAACNAQFYDALEHYITETQGHYAWQRFQDVVYKPREKLPDRPWMNQISHFLEHNPVFLAKFKESIGYVGDDDEESLTPATTSFVLQPQQPPSPPSSYSCQSTGSINTIGSRSKRLSSMSLGDALDYNDDDDNNTVSCEGMFSTKDQFYHSYQQQNVPTGARRRSSYHSMQSEPHPTFVESKIDEVDEANIQVEARRNEDQDSDHLADLLDSEDDDDDDDHDHDNNNNNNDNNDNHGDHLRRMNDRNKDIGAGSSTPTGGTGRHRSSRNYCDMDLIKLREDSHFQASLPSTHADYFRKTKQLLSMAPSSSRFSATVRRNSILEDALPSSPVTELDEPRVQTCCETDGDDTDDDHLARLICTSRRQQPDDIVWLNSVTEALAGWPELIDRLHEIVQEDK